MVDADKTLGFGDESVIYWLFDPFTGADIADGWDDGIQPQSWQPEDLTTPERVAERRRYDQCVEWLRSLCIRW